MGSILRIAGGATIGYCGGTAWTETGNVWFLIGPMIGMILFGLGVVADE